MPEFHAWGTEHLDYLLSLAVAIVPLLVFGECAFLFFFRRHRIHWKDFLNNVTNGIVHRYFNLLIWTPFYFLLHGSLKKWAFFDIEVQSIALWVGVFVLTDFCYYWFHRSLHAIPLLWTFHDSHHSSPYVHWLSAFRLNWMIGGLRALSHIPITLLGVDPQVTYFCYILVLVYQIFIHSEYQNFPGFMEKVFNTPAHHRVHHSKHRSHHDSNFGGTFIFWDKLFGTFHSPETNPISYGVAEHDGMRNPIYLNFAPMMNLFKKAFRQNSWIQGLGVLLKEESTRPRPSGQKA